MTQQALQRRANPAGLQAVKDNGVNALVNFNMKDLTELAEAAFSSGMFTDIKNAGVAKMKILAGREVGLEPITSLMSIHFFNNRIVYGAGVYAGLIKESKKYEYEIVEHTADKCVIQFYKTNGEKFLPSGPPVEYNKTDAGKAGLAGKDVYTKFGDDMYFAGAMRKGFRRHCPDLLRGGAKAIDDGTTDAEFLAPPEFERPESEPSTDSPATEAPDVQVPMFTGSDEPERSREDLVAEVKALGQQLNKAGDSIKWTAGNLTNYVNDLFSVDDGLDSLSFESFDILIGDMQGRLETLNNEQL